MPTTAIGFEELEARRTIKQRAGVGRGGLIG